MLWFGRIFCAAQLDCDSSVTRLSEAMRTSRYASPVSRCKAAALQQYDLSLPDQSRRTTQPVMYTSTLWVRLAGWDPAGSQRWVWRWVWRRDGGGGCRGTGDHGMVIAVTVTDSEQ